MLGALERRDAETMSRLQSTHELALLDKVRAGKQDQHDEAVSARDALTTARAMAVMRRDYYASRDFVNTAELWGLELMGHAVAAQTAATLLDILAAALS